MAEAAGRLHGDGRLGEALKPNGAEAAPATAREAPPLYRPPLSKIWWLRNRRYLTFMLREFTAVPVALWLLSLLVQVSRLGAGREAYYAYTSPRYVVFSVICLAFAVFHSFTWLGISGLILRVPLGEKDLDPKLVTGANYALWVVATVVIGALLVFLGRR